MLFQVIFIINKNANAHNTNNFSERKNKTVNILCINIIARETNY